MSIIKQSLLDQLESQQEDIEVDSDVQIVYCPIPSILPEPPSRSDLLD